MKHKKHLRQKTFYTDNWSDAVWSHVKKLCDGGYSFSRYVLDLIVKDMHDGKEETKEPKEKEEDVNNK